MTDPLEVLVDPCLGERGDWEDVLRRAELSVGVARPRRRRWRVAAVAVTVLMLLAVLAATPALGLRDAMLDLIGRNDVEFDQGDPAPRLVRWQFEDLGLGAPAGMDPQAIPGQARRVGTFRVGGRARALWVAPTRRGGFCYTLEEAYGGCLRNGGPELPPSR